MRRLLIIFLLVLPTALLSCALALTGCIIGAQDFNDWWEWSGNPERDLWLTIVPGTVLGALAAATVSGAFSRKILFDPRVLHPIRLLVVGSIAAVLGAAIGQCLLGYLDDTIPDNILLAIGAALGMLLVCAFLRRTRPFHCIACGYDLRSTLGPGSTRCPECGRDEFARAAPGIA